MEYDILESGLRRAKSMTKLAKQVFLRSHMTPILGENTVDMMIFNGFCSAPASTRFHGCYNGGLFEHSLGVACCLQKYTEKLGLEWSKEDSPIRIGMLHDLCKIDIYKEEKSIEGETSYTYDNSPIVKGHGDKSVIYAINWGCPLTDEEIACIIYHMGAYEKDRWDAFDNAIKKYPNVLYTHTADMAASKILGV